MKHKDSLPTCEDCGKVFQTTDGLKIHSYRHVTDRPHQCQLCSKSYLRSAHLKRHMNISHGDLKSDGIFDHDDATFNNTTDSNNMSKVYECPYCPNYYVKKKYLERHLQTHHFLEQISQENDSSKIVEFKCDQCDISFSQKNQYEAHLNTHKVNKPDRLLVKCNDCDKVYLSRGAMRKHAKKHDKSNLFKTRTCPYCSRSFTDYILFLRHKSLHIRNPTRQCTRCYKPYTLKHVCIQKSKPSIFCQLCTATFHSSKDYNEHVRNEHATHRSTDDAFICKLCGKEFLQLRYFVTHFKCRHADCPTNKHKCDLCGRTYSKRKYLTKHRLSHLTTSTQGATGVACTTEEEMADSNPKIFKYRLADRPNNKHKCDFCPRTYSKKRYLTKHRLSHITTPQEIDAADAEDDGDVYWSEDIDGCQDDQEIYFEEDYGGIAFIPD